MIHRTPIASFALIVIACFLTGTSEAGLSDKKAVAKSSGKYKGFWSNESGFAGTFFKTDDPPGSFDFKIEGSIRLPRKPKKLKFKLPASLLIDEPVTRMTIKKTTVRRCGKLIIHKANGSQDQSVHFGAGSVLKGKGQVKLKARGNKYRASGNYSAKDPTPIGGPDAVKGKFKGKG